MRYSYDISNIDKETSYIKLVDNYLYQLGFKLNNNGTRFLRDLILTAYFMQYYDISIENIVSDFFKINTIQQITKQNYTQRIYYAIQNTNKKSLKNNFPIVFGIEFDYEFTCIKNLLILFVNTLNKAK